jgi:hypothetical protein
MLVHESPNHLETPVSAPAIDRRAVRIERFVRRRAMPPKAPSPRTRNPLASHPPAML